MPKHEPNYKLVTPEVHLNGTSLDGLNDQYRDAYVALSQAGDVIRRGYPHMRDYYVLGASSQEQYQKARDQHDLRLKKLEDLMQEFVDLSALLLARTDDKRGSSRARA